MHSTAARIARSEQPVCTGWDHLRSLLPVERFDVSAIPQPTGVPAAFPRDAFTADIARGLFRHRKGHVLLTGDPGVGKTTLLRELARRTQAGAFPFLAGKPLVRLDVSNVGPEDSRACLEAILAAAMEDHNLILCLDGMAALFPRANGGTNKPLLRTLLAFDGLKVVGTMTDWEYAEHIGGDAQMLPLVTRVRLPEPDEADAIAIARTAVHAITKTHRVEISEEIVRRAVALASTFLINERHPAKGLHVLWHAAESLRYSAPPSDAPSLRLGEADLIRSVAELTDLPPETISGEGAACDFDAALRAAIVGQEEAVREVATELRLITAGLTEADKPASVMLFAGSTGVGKTELAKRIAELYSSSRRVNVYSMGNFTESHSVSGLVGVPPGYVGHDQGGRLINDLNADPYTVFLLDEAEKCHPNVWKPFLHLFDEGWIVDQRGIKAYADRAIFILTTNAGDRNIGQLAKSGKSREEIAEQVRKALSRVRHERSSQVVFPPQFLARIKRIIVFEPLSREAMCGIARLTGQRVRRLWLTKQGKEIRFAPEVIEAIGTRAHALNEQSGGQEGGRIVRKLFADLIERPIQEAAVAHPERFRASRLVDLELMSSENCEFQVRLGA